MEQVKDYGDLVKVFEEALKQIKDRQSSYGSRWLEEPLDYLWQNVWRKSTGLRFMVIDNKSKDTLKIEECLLDLISYCAMMVVRLKEVSSENQ